MSTIIAEVAPQRGEQDPRAALMHAFAVAETVVAQLTDQPRTVNLNDDLHGNYVVELYFHHAPEQVARFAAVFDVEVSTVGDYGPRGGTYTSAQCTVDRVLVRGWALMVAEDGAA